MSPGFKAIFARLREILVKHSETLAVTGDTPERYCLSAKVGPATVHAWGGKMKKAMIPVAWVEVGESYVSYHLMGVYGSPKLWDNMSKQLKGRMQGKTCFNFRNHDEKLFAELDQLTTHAVAAFKKAGFIRE
ncbi:MAG TPA: hypothetical protein VIM11_15845 [Tepidisphaeraceae bacterium]